MAADSQYCPNCGTANEADAVFCESCGNPLHQAEASPAGVAYAEPEPARSRRMSPALIAVLAVVVVAAAGALVFRAPLASFVKSKGGTTAAQADSLKLAAGLAPAVPELNDRPSDQNLARPGQPEPTESGTPLPAFSQPAAPQRRSEQTSRTRIPAAPPLGSSPPQGMVITRAPEEPRASREPDQPFSAGAASSITVTKREAPTAPAVGRIAAGSTVSLRAADQVCTDKTREGARFRGVVQEDIEGSNGARIPKGTVVNFVVDRLRRSGNPNDKVDFSIAPETIEIGGSPSPLAASVDAVTVKPQRRGLFGALAGAALGVAVTKAAGGDTRAAVAAGAAGGAAGAVIGNQIKNGDGCIEKNSAIRITLQADLPMRAM